ncbi:hypothetical protein IC617_08705 [Neiella sp. HB171785]|uniref:Uncharacterized protein n=1 Tax=Neiella litorisoli TaxID=2771431 RepID=A0A8J6UG28_9GAMM|nr:hypothetical protein [Neiella litorisoli]MBD1389506.1 hypothetical protein [Neiella litorisoli]
MFVEYKEEALQTKDCFTLGVILERDDGDLELFDDSPLTLSCDAREQEVLDVCRHLSILCPIGQVLFATMQLNKSIYQSATDACAEIIKQPVRSLSLSGQWHAFSGLFNRSKKPLAHGELRLQDWRNLERLAVTACRKIRLMSVPQFLARSHAYTAVYAGKLKNKRGRHVLYVANFGDKHLILGELHESEERWWNVAIVDNDQMNHVFAVVHERNLGAAIRIEQDNLCPIVSSVTHDAGQRAVSLNLFINKMQNYE